VPVRMVLNSVRAREARGSAMDVISISPGAVKEGASNR